MNTYGYSGKILVVNLSNGSLNELSTSDYAGKFIGGRGFGISFSAKFFHRVHGVSTLKTAWYALPVRSPDFLDLPDAAGLYAVNRLLGPRRCFLTAISVVNGAPRLNPLVM